MNHSPEIGSARQRADIQGLRAIAVGFVLLFHFGGIVKGGYLGVDMFFVISGFVIAQSTIREIRETSFFNWQNFLRRRVRRLLPGASVILVFSALAGLILLSPFGPQKETARMIVGAATYSTNFLLMPRGYFAIKSGSNPLLHFWSLAVEEQFYAAWPFVVLFFVYLRRRVGNSIFRLSLTTCLTLTFVVSCSLFYFCIEKSVSIEHFSIYDALRQRNVSLVNFGFYSPFTRAWEFIAGVIGCLFVQKRLTKQSNYWSGFSWAIGLISVIFSVFAVSAMNGGDAATEGSSRALPTMLCVLGTTSLLVSGTQLGFSNKTLGIFGLRKIGDWSYSIYLWHWPLWAFATRVWEESSLLATAIAAISVGFGALQYMFFEDPIRQKKIWKKAPSLGLVATLITGSIVVAASYAWISPLIAMRIAGRTTGDSALHIIERPCQGSSISIGGAQSCVFSNPEGERTAVLVGDSMAKSLSDGFTTAASNLGMKSFVFFLPGCAFLREETTLTYSETCGPWRKNVFEAIHVLNPDVVVISNLNSLYIEILNRSYDQETSLEIWGSELRSILEETKQETQAILVVQPPPKFIQDVKYDISLVEPIGKPENRNDVVARRNVVNSLESEVVSGNGAQIQLLNFDSIFCGENTCSQVVDGQLMFEDGDHLTPQGSLLLVTQLEEQIKQLLEP